MNPNLSRAILVPTLLAVTACAPSPSTGGSQLADAGAPARPAERTLQIAVSAEPKTIAAGASPGSGTTVSTSIRLFNAMLDLVDDRGVARPYLAEALPQLDTDTWQVLPDGRMETRYTLKPDLAWHDGPALSAEDFAFAWRVDSTPELGINTVAPLNQVEDVMAQDARTVIIRWKRLYPDAGVTQTGGHLVGLAPLPRHILDAPFRDALADGRWDAFSGNVFWTREYVGLGPFRLARWEPGSVIEGTAFERHALGRPKIDRVRVMFVTDGNAGLVVVLAGDVHIAMDQAIEFQQGLELKRRWAPTGVGSVISSAQAWTGMAVQFRPDMVTPRAVLDARLRRALAHALDEDEVNQAVYEGEGIPAESVFPPSLEFYPLIERAIMRYAHDARAAERLMGEAGFVKAADGFFTGPDGRLSIDLRTSGGERNEKERGAVASVWRQGGFDIQESVLPAAQAQDGQARSTFPGLFHYSVGLSEASLLGAFSTSSIAGPGNRWAGNNRGGWSNPAYDSVLAAFQGTLNRDERMQQRISMAQMLSEELPSIPLAYRINSVAHVAALSGVPRTSSPGSSGIFSWNVHEWELR